MARIMWRKGHFSVSPPNFHRTNERCLVLGESGRVFGFIWAFILLEAIKLSGFVLGLYIIRQRCACVCVWLRTHTHAKCVCVDGGDKEGTGKTSGTVKEKKTPHFLQKEREILSSCQMQHEWEGKFKESWYLKINKRKFNEKTICRSGRSSEKNAHSELGCPPAFSEVSSCWLLKPTHTVGSRPPWQHSGLSVLEGPRHNGAVPRPRSTSGYRWRRFFVFLCVLGDLDSWVCGWLLETFPTYNKPWLKGQIFMQIAAWKERIEVFNRQITYF